MAKNRNGDVYYRNGNGYRVAYNGYNGASGTYLTSGVFSEYNPWEHQQTIIEPRQIAKEYVCAYCGSERENNKMKCKSCGAAQVKEKVQPRVAPATIIRKEEVDDAVVKAATKVKDTAETIVNDTIDSWATKIRRKLGI